MKKIFMILVMIGTVMLFGTAGASDVGNITVGRACMQGIASVGFLFSGMLGMLLVAWIKFVCAATVVIGRQNGVYQLKKHTFILSVRNFDAKILPKFVFDFYVFLLDSGKLKKYS